MKISQLLFPALASAAATNMPPDFDPSGACSQACDAYLNPKRFVTKEERQKANLDCYNGCMGIVQMPSVFSSQDISAKQARSAYVDQVYTEMVNELQPAPAGLEQALENIRVTMLCAAGCEDDNGVCGFGCFRNMTASDTGVPAIAARQLDDDEGDDNIIDQFISRRQADDEDDSDGDDSDLDDGDDDNDYVRSSQIVLAARGFKGPCLSNCKPEDIRGKKWKCVDKCTQDAGLSGQKSKDKTRTCMTPISGIFHGDYFKQKAADCQKELDQRVANANAGPPRRHRRAATSTDSIEWAVSTTTWATSGTLALLVPTSRTTSTTTLLAEVTATQTVDRWATATVDKWATKTESSWVTETVETTATASVDFGVMSVFLPPSPTRTPTPVKYTTSMVVMSRPTVVVVTDEVKEQAIGSPASKTALTTSTKAGPITSSCTTSSAPTYITDRTTYAVTADLATRKVDANGITIMTLKKGAASSNFASASRNALFGLSAVIAGAMLL